MKKKIIICSVILVAFAAVLFVGAKNYHEKIKKDNIVIAREKVKAANISHELYLLNEAKELLKSVDGEEKEELLKTIEEIEKEIAKDRVLNNYLNKINKLKKDYSVEEYEKLKEEIINIEYEDIKEELLNKIDNLDSETVEEEENKEEKVEEKETTDKEKKAASKEEVLETITGNISAYRPTTSGFLANGYFVGNNKATYKDPTYGDIFIVAADESYPFGTIVKIKNLEVFEMQDAYAIVLDRKDNVGKDKKSLFALLLDTDKDVNGFGVVKNVSCDIVRLGF